MTARRIMYQVSVTFDDEGDAQALATIIRELGLRPHVNALTPSENASASGTRLGKLVLGMFAERATAKIGIQEITEHLEENGYAATSAQPTVLKLCREGKMSRVGHGRYALKGDRE